MCGEHVSLGLAPLSVGWWLAMLTSCWDDWLWGLHYLSGWSFDLYQFDPICVIFGPPSSQVLKHNCLLGVNSFHEQVMQTPMVFSSHFDPESKSWYPAFWEWFSSGCSHRLPNSQPPYRRRTRHTSQSMAKARAQRHSAQARAKRAHGSRSATTMDDSPWLWLW